MGNTRGIDGSRRMRFALILGAALVAAALTACGGGSSSKTETATASGTAGSVANASSTAAPSATSTPGVAPAATETTTITVVAKDTLFQPSTLSAPAGGITISLVNQDAGVLHNIQFFAGGASIGMTPLATGPTTQALSLGSLQPGTYTFKCDVHPQQMNGTLTVR